MANFILDLTPSDVNFGGEGGLDTSILDGNSIQRQGFIEVYNGANKKMLELTDGEEFNNTIPTWSSNPNIVAA